MKVLLHICCAPCSIYPFKELSKVRGTQVKGFYFNPNIHPEQEYLKRRRAIEEYSRTIDLEVIYPEYEPNGFFKKIIYKENPPTRCRTCWQMRLEETALYAKENGFDGFSTTLLISPYQEHLAVKEIGEGLSERFDLDFYYQDFRTGFKVSQDEARTQSLYRQKYCGCIYSLIERFAEKQEKAYRKAQATAEKV